MATAVEAADPQLTELYDGLARYQWMCRRLARARPGESLAMRKRLRPGDGELAGVDHLNSWLWDFAAPRDEAKVLDVGAGFGDTLLDWAGRAPGQYVGIGLSPYQVRRAREQATHLNRDVRFELASFDAALIGEHAPLREQADIAVSVETLFHAPDLAHAVQNIASALRTGGTLVLVEDMTKGPTACASPAGQELLRRWTTQTLHGDSDYRSAFAAAGLEIDRELDLSALLNLCSPERRERRRRRLLRLRSILPLGRRVLDAFLGGLAMEDLQASGDLRYRAMRVVKQ